MKKSPPYKGPPYPLQVAAKRLNLPRSFLYGVLLAYGIKPTAGISKKEKHAKLLSAAQFARIKQRLRAAGHAV